MDSNTGESNVEHVLKELQQENSDGKAPCSAPAACSQEDRELKNLKNVLSAADAQAGVSPVLPEDLAPPANEAAGFSANFLKLEQMLKKLNESKGEKK